MVLLSVNGYSLFMYYLVNFGSLKNYILNSISTKTYKLSMYYSWWKLMFFRTMSRNGLQSVVQFHLDLVFKI